MIATVAGLAIAAAAVLFVIYPLISTTRKDGGGRKGTSQER